MPDHLGIDKIDSHIAILTGNPERVESIATQFRSSSVLSDRRGFICSRAMLGKTPILVVSTGIGAPTTAIVVEELIELGITVLVRLGTCGALQSKISVGDLVIPTACVREEGTSREYVDVAFPAIPDHELLYRLIKSADHSKNPCHVGITHCKDAYYSERPDKQLVSEHTRHRWEAWRKAGVLATEMESSALFVLGQLRSVRTGAIFINVGKITDKMLFDNSLNIAIDIIHRALKSLIKDDLIPTPTFREPSSVSFLDKLSD